NTKTEVESTMQKLKTAGLPLDGLSRIYFLDSGNDFEAELISHGLRHEVIKALLLWEIDGISNPRKLEVKERETLKELNKLSDNELIEKMRKAKSSYSGFLADVLLE